MASNMRQPHMQNCRLSSAGSVDMDPLSISASVLALCGAVGALGKAVGTVVRLKDADAEIAQAAEQLSIIRRVNRELEMQQAIEQETSRSLGLVGSISGIGRIIGASHDLITAIEAAFPKPRDNSRRMRQFRWTLKDQQTAKRLQAQLNNIGTLLSTCLHLENVNETRSLKPSIESFTAKQELLYDELLLMKERISSLVQQTSTEHLLPLPSAFQHTRKKMSRNSTQRRWLAVPGFMIQYYRLTGHRRRYSLLFGLRIPGSKVMFAQLSGSWYSSIGFPSFCISVRNLIPEGSEFIMACKRGEVPIAKRLLLSRQAGLGDITTTNETPLTAACDSRSTELVQLLLDLGADPNQTCGKMQTSPLHVAFELNEPEIARQLIRNGADIEYVSARGWNVIHHLWEHIDGGENSQEFYDICSAEGFNSYDVQDGMGWSCLHRAAAFGTPRDIQCLLQRGASMSIYTKNHDWSPIHVAAVMNNVGALEALSLHCTEKSLHSRDAHGWTSLHLAVDREAEDTMRFLLKRNADPLAQTYLNSSWFPVGLEHQILRPGDLALNCGTQFFQTYSQALLEAGCKITTSVDDDDIYWDSTETLLGDMKTKFPH